MERNGNWLNWAALIVGGLALLFALGGRGEGRVVEVQVGNGPVAAAPAAPGDPRGFQPGFDPRNQGDYAPGYGRGEYGPGFGPMQGGRHGFGPFSLIGGILKFLGFLLLVGLVLRFVAGRRGWGGPPWRRGWHGGPHGDAPKQEQPERREGDSDEPTSPSTGETVRL